MDNEQTFGTFIRSKRVNLGPYISLRKMAELLEISPVYMSNIESGRNPAPKDNILEHLQSFYALPYRSGSGCMSWQLS